MDELTLAQAKKIYEGICAALDNREWHYERIEEKLMLRFTVNGDDIPMTFLMFVDAGHQTVRILSFLPFKAAEDKRLEMAMAVCAANYNLVEGNFDYDIAEGALSFRVTASYRESEIGDALFQRMISLACAVVDEYNDRFLALSKGYLSLEDFIKRG